MMELTEESYISEILPSSSEIRYADPVAPVTDSSAEVRHFPWQAVASLAAALLLLVPFAYFGTKGLANLQPEAPVPATECRLTEPETTAVTEPTCESDAARTEQFRQFRISRRNAQSFLHNGTKYGWDLPEQAGALLLQDIQNTVFYEVAESERTQFRILTAQYQSLSHHLTLHILAKGTFPTYHFFPEQTTVWMDEADWCADTICSAPYATENRDGTLTVNFAVNLHGYPMALQGTGTRDDLESLAAFYEMQMLRMDDPQFTLHQINAMDYPWKGRMVDADTIGDMTYLTAVQNYYMSDAGKDVDGVTVQYENETPAEDGASEWEQCSFGYYQKEYGFPVYGEVYTPETLYADKILRDGEKTASFWVDCGRYWIWFYARNDSGEAASEAVIRDAVAAIRKAECTP